MGPGQIMMLLKGKTVFDPSFEVTAPPLLVS